MSFINLAGPSFFGITAKTAKVLDPYRWSDQSRLSLQTYPLTGKLSENARTAAAPQVDLSRRWMVTSSLTFALGASFPGFSRRILNVSNADSREKAWVKTLPLV